MRVFKKRRANELVHVRKAAEKVGLRIVEGDDTQGKSSASVPVAQSSEQAAVPEVGGSDDTSAGAVTEGKGTAIVLETGTQAASSAPEADSTPDGTTQKRGRGRPPGSKNRKTLEREAAEAAAGIIHVKRKPGRLPGSKNKKTLEREAREAELSGLRPDRS